MHLRTTGPEDLPRSVPELRTYDRVVAAFPQEGTTHEIVVWSDQPLDRTAVAAAQHRLEAAAAADPRLFAATESGTPEYSPDGKVAHFDVAVAYNQSDPRAREGLQRAANVAAASGVRLGPRHARAPSPGQIAEDADFSAAFKAHLPLVVGFVLLLTFVVLVLAFRSVVIAGTAIALNLLSVGAAYGLLVLVFQHTWAEGLLGFHSSGAVMSWLPLFLFVVLFGLSMDYHVFVVSRIREAKLRGLSTKDAVADGVTRSAGVVTSAAIVMVGVFGDLRDAVAAGLQAARRRAGGGGPARRHPRPGGAAAVGDGRARSVELVAPEVVGAPAPPRGRAPAPRWQRRCSAGAGRG